MASDETEYNESGSEYIEWKKWSIQIREPVQDYTILKCMLPSVLNGDGLLTGQRVLDLACGEGYYTRKLKALNCAYIIGVDISSKMIDIARRIEHQSPQNIEYTIADALQLPSPEEPFDLVTAFHLLSYARTRDELLRMARNIYACLGDNKYFIGITLNVVGGKAIFNTDKYRKYGLEYSVKTPLDNNSTCDGMEVEFKLYNKREEVVTAFKCYYLSPETYEQVFKEAGFSTFQWIPFQCDPATPNRAFYNDLINCANAIGIIAFK